MIRDSAKRPTRLFAYLTQRRIISAETQMKVSKAGSISVTLAYDREDSPR